MEQRSLWDEPAQEDERLIPTTHDLDATIWQRCQKSPLALKEQDITALRTWLLAWGKRHGYPGFSFPFSRDREGKPDPIDRRYGLVYEGAARWEHDFTPPHAQTEWYAGEWLVKCMEQVRRYDTGKEKMPWVEFNLEATRSPGG